MINVTNKHLSFWTAIVLVVLTLGAVAQTTTPQAPPAPEQSEQARGKAPSDFKITPEQAQELLRSVDEILQFVSQKTGLPIRHPVKREMASREQVAKYIQERMKEDEDAKRLEKSELVLKRFGLLPREFNLRSFLVSLLREQVAGYYNAKNQTVYLLDWVLPEEQKPVLAHELTHALQDQNFGLEKFSKGAKQGPEFESDERLAARQAIIEGQGMVVLIDYLLAPLGQSITSAPQIADAIQTSMTSAPNMVVYNNAPLYIQQTLLFPYRYGLDFVRTLLAKGGKDTAFAGVFRNPPANTRQVMEPATYLEREKLPPLVPPDFAKLTSEGYRKFDIGALGEFDLATMIAEYGNEATSRMLYPKFRGAYYYAAEIRENAGALPAVVFVSRWANAESAVEFAGIYAAGMKKRYSGVSETLPVTFKTSEGVVLVEPHGDLLLVTEGFDEKTVARIREAVFGRK